MKTKAFWVILFAGILLRIFLAASTYHPDLRTFQYAGFVMGSGNVLNFYDYLFIEDSGKRIAQLVVFNYPPAIYFFHGIFNFMFSSVFGMDAVNSYLIDIEEGLGKFKFMFQLFLIKIPYIIFDSLIAIYITKLFDNNRQKLLAFSLWWFNPVNLFSTYMLSQFDVIPTFFVLLSLVFVKYKKLSLGALSLGIGIAFKIFPLFLLIPLILMEKSWLGRFKLVILGLVPYLLLILPYLPSFGFRSTALVASQTDKSFFAEIAISGGEKIILFPAFLIFLYLVFYFVQNKINFSLYKKYLLTLLIFYIFTHIHPQWFLWIVPLLIIELIETRFKHLLLVVIVLITYITSLFLYDPSLTVRIFAPLAPSLHELPNIWAILGVDINLIVARSILQSLFVAVAIYYIYTYFPSKNE